MWSDPIADLLTRIRNSARIQSKEVTIPRSNEKLGVCKVLCEEGYLTSVEEIEDNKQGVLRVTLKYGPRGQKVLTQLKRESKCGCRKYVGVSEIPRVLNGLGIAILSTNRGILSDRKCRELNIGGELICTVY